MDFINVELATEYRIYEGIDIRYVLHYFPMMEFVFKINAMLLFERTEYLYVLSLLLQKKNYPSF